MGTLPGDSIKTASPGLLHDSGKEEQQPIFAEPWEAHAFAIAKKISPKLDTSNIVVVDSCGDSLKDKDIIKKHLGNYSR